VNACIRVHVNYLEHIRCRLRSSDGVLLLWGPTGHWLVVGVDCMALFQEHLRQRVGPKRALK